MEALATQAPESSTPILDRLAPLPAPPRFSPLRVLLGILIGVLIGLLLAVMFWYSPALQRNIGVPLLNWLDAKRTGSQSISLFLVFVIVQFAAIFFHELGHALGGLAAGFQLISLRVGPLVFESRLRISWYRGPGALGSGGVRAIAARRDNLRLRSAVYIFAGSAASLLSGGIVLVLVPSGDFSPTLFVLASAALFAGSLIPHRTRVGISDGGRLWLLWRNRAPCERWLALMKLDAEEQEGVLTQERLSEYLAKATAVRDASPDTVLAHVQALSVAQKEQRGREAGELLEVCLQYSNHTPDLRDALISDSAMFQALQRERIDLAEQWLADLSAKHDPRLRLRCEAVILQARGDFPGALRKLEDYEKAVLAMPNPARREILLRGLAEWKAGLKAA